MCGDGWNDHSQDLERNKAGGGICPVRSTYKGSFDSNEMMYWMHPPPPLTASVKPYDVKHYEITMAFAVTRVIDPPRLESGDSTIET
jgi:hypothetical protein